MSIPKAATHESLLVAVMARIACDLRTTVKTIFIDR